MVSCSGKNSVITCLQHNISILSVPQNKFSTWIHEYINHLCRMLFPVERPTSLAHSSFRELLVRKTRKIQQMREKVVWETRPWLNLQSIVAKGHWGREDLGFLGCLLWTTHMEVNNGTTILKTVHFASQISYATLWRGKVCCSMGRIALGVGLFVPL